MHICDLMLQSTFWWDTHCQCDKGQLFVLYLMLNQEISAQERLFIIIFDQLLEEKVRMLIFTDSLVICYFINHWNYQMVESICKFVQIHQLNSRLWYQKNTVNLNEVSQIHLLKKTTAVICRKPREIVDSFEQHEFVSEGSDIRGHAIYAMQKLIIKTRGTMLKIYDGCQHFLIIIWTWGKFRERKKG